MYKCINYNITVRQYLDVPAFCGILYDLKKSYVLYYNIYSKTAKITKKAVKV